MEKLLVKGEKVVIARINDPAQQMVFSFIYPRETNLLYDIDIFAVPMDERGRAGKDYIVFYGNPALEGGGILYEENYEPLQVSKELNINLSKIPNAIQKICLACSVYCKNKDKQEEAISIDFKMDATNKTLRSHMFISKDSIDLINDEVLILGEIYKYKDTWKYNAVKQNLDEEIMISLKKLYGLEVY